MNKLQSLIKKVNEDMSTPKAEFAVQQVVINKYIPMISNRWQKIEDTYKAQLAKEPGSWQGLGRGSELTDFASHVRTMIENMDNWLKSRE
jgi:hypothetical protein